MKILFLGEYSGLYNNLKEGLKFYDIDSLIVGSGDGFKNINADINWSINENFIKKIKLYYKVYKIAKNSDLIMIVNPGVFVTKFRIKGILYFKLLKSLKKNMYLTCAGDDYFYIKEGRNKYRYFPYSDFEENELPWNTKKDLKINLLVANGSKKIIPNSYDYAEAYRGRFDSKLAKTIPMPINVDKIKYKDNIVKTKIVIFHGLSRERFKGTRYIKEAMELIKENYSDKVEIIIDGKMPLDQYLKVMEKSNIVIDQCKSYGYGMNALYSLAKGKVTFSGAEKEVLDEISVCECPIINIRPDVKDIYEKLEYFILNSDEINKYGKLGREYVESLHNYKKIAEKYIEIWNE